MSPTLSAMLASKKRTPETAVFPQPWLNSRRHSPQAAAFFAPPGGQAPESHFLLPRAPLADRR